MREDLHPKSISGADQAGPDHATRPATLNLGFLYTAHCNALCAHCSTDCGPKARTYLDEAAIGRTIDEAADACAGRRLQVCFSGGEPFLDTGLLGRLVAHAARRASDVTCVTNAFWATNSEVAGQVLGALVANGLTGLAVSASAFHAPFVPSGRVVTALSTALRFGLRRFLKFPATAGSEGATEWAERVGCDLTGVTLEQFAVMPALRAGVRLPDHAYQRSPGIPAGSCPGATITYRETGDVFTCCTPGGFVGPLRIGHIAEDGFEAVFNRFATGGLQQVLRTEGPAGFVPHIRAAGLGHRLRDSYDGVCDLCTHMLSDPAMAEVCDRVAVAREVETLAGWLGVVPPSSIAATAGSPGAPVGQLPQATTEQRPGRCPRTPLPLAEPTTWTENRREPANGQSGRAAHSPR
jgi:hypothetical protein